MMARAPAAALLRIQRIEIEDFRAFPAGHPVRLYLAGCNLLAFGENGSGKSSIYRALRQLFSLDADDLTTHRNVFGSAPIAPAPYVRITLSDGQAFEWNSGAHPTAAVRDIARRAAFLTHTRLREMSYNSAGAALPANLFDFAVSKLLADFEATLPGGGRSSIGELWAAVLATQTTRNRGKTYVRQTQDAIDRFNDGMRQAIEALEGRAKPLLGRLLSVLAPDGLELVGLTFPQIRYAPERGRPERDGDPRAIDNRVLTPVVKVRSHQPPAPQAFLNEGRQSALAIAICLAARQACVPAGRDRLKLLVLDDLLLSLDASHRRPVLDVILSEFAEWQLILLTHDRYWFQLAREQVKETGAWKAVEIYERYDGDDLLVPLVRPVADDLVDETLKQADAFLADNYPYAAANYARSACELVLKRFCTRKRVLFPYFEDERRPDLQALLTVAQARVVGDAARHKALKDLEGHKKYVLNPLSHDLANPVPAADVAAAILAVREVAKACGKTYP